MELLDIDQALDKIFLRKIPVSKYDAPEAPNCRAMWLGAILQAKEDYVNLSPLGRLAWDYRTAEAFLFDDSYKISLGEIDVNLQQLLDMLFPSYVIDLYKYRAKWKRQREQKLGLKKK